MAKNIVEGGKRMTVVAPSGGLVSGTPKLIANTFLVPITNAASGANCACMVDGVATLDKTSGASTSFAQGAIVYWDNTNGKATVSATSNRIIGSAEVAAANADATMTVRLDGAIRA